MSDFNRLQWDNREEGNTPLRQMQLVEVRLLKIVDYICRKHGLTYMLFWGSLLGAVRHKGFIPWDDDIDVWMSESDCRKFVKVAAEELPNDVFLQTCKTDDSYTLPWIKLRDNYSSVYTNVEEFNARHHVGISLDIFPFVAYPKDSRIIRKLQHFTMLVGWFAMQRHARSFKTRLAHYFAIVPSFILEHVWWLLRKCCKLVAFGPHQLTGGVSSYVRFPIDSILPTKEIVFEGQKFSAPAMPEFVLRQFYGDYMKLPPEEKRVPHESNIFPFTPCRHTHAMEYPKGGNK